jgi:hypothetical protein
LAFPLFVVVVGVDSRWLLRSLELAYRDIITSGRDGADPDDALHWAATPQNYLDKIFQIPLTLRPMDVDGYKRLVRDLAGNLPDSPDGARRDGTAGNDSQELARELPEGDARMPADEPAPLILTDAPPAEMVCVRQVEDKVVALAFSSEDRQLLVLQTEGSLLRLATRSAELLGLPRRLTTSPGTAALSADGSQVAWSSPEGVHIAGTAGRMNDQPAVWPTPADTLALSPAGDWLAMATAEQVFTVPVNFPDKGSTVPVTFRVPLVSSDLGGAIRLWALPDGTAVAAQDREQGYGDLLLLTPQGATTLAKQNIAAALSSDGELTASADRHGVRLLQVVDGRVTNEVELVRLEGVRAMAFSPDDRLLAIGTADRIFVLDVASGHPVAQGDCDGPVDQLSFGARGRTIASASGTTVQVLTLSARGDLRAVNLDLSTDEREFIEGLLPLVRTPRAAKRLVNVYRIMRAPLPDGALQSDHRAVLLMLALLNAFPEQGAALIERLVRNPAADWATHLADCRAAAPHSQEVIWQSLTEGLERLPAGHVEQDIQPYVQWAGKVARFSFRAGMSAAPRQLPAS